MLRPVARAWPGLVGDFNTFVFLWQSQPVKAIFSGRGKTKKGFLCATLCDMEMDGQLDLYQM